MTHLRRRLSSGGIPKNRGIREFKPPWSGPEEDWVLVLDDESRYVPLGIGSFIYFFLL